MNEKKENSQKYTFILKIKRKRWRFLKFGHSS